MRARHRRRRAVAVRQLHRRALRIGHRVARDRPRDRRARRAPRAGRRARCSPRSPARCWRRAGSDHGARRLAARRRCDGGVPLRSRVRDAAPDRGRIVSPRRHRADAVRRSSRAPCSGRCRSSCSIRSAGAQTFAIYAALHLVVCLPHPPVERARGRRRADARRAGPTRAARRARRARVRVARDRAVARGVHRARPSPRTSSACSPPPASPRATRCWSAR